MSSRKIIVAVTGASGAIYALSLMKRLRELPDPPAEVAVILTGNAEEIMLYETGTVYVPSGTEKLWDNKDFNAPFASGSSSYDTMIICPASMGMVGRIAHGVSLTTSSPVRLM